MLYLDINQSKEIVVTAGELATLYVDGNGYALPTYFTWKITDADTNNSYIFTADDLSPTPWYYNMFSFSVIPGATYGLTQGVIPAPQGIYSYCVYQTQTQYDLATTNLLEKGILNIEGTYSIINTFTQSSGNVITFKNL